MNGGAEGGEGSAKISLPSYVKDNLGKEVYEDWSKRIEKDPEFAKQIPATLPEFAKTWDSGRSQLAEISKKYKEAEEGRKAPNSPQDYAFDKTELPKGMVYDQQLEEAFRTWAHEEKLTAAQAKNLFSKFTEANKQRFQVSSEQAAKQAAEAEKARQAALVNVRAELRTRWGESYDSRMPRNIAALDNPAMIPPELATAFRGLLIQPLFHLWWDRQVAMMSNDRKLGLNREEGDGMEEEDKNKKTVTGADGRAHLKDGFFANTAKRNPRRKAG